MFETAGTISSLSIVPAFIIALIKYRTRPDFRPFMWLIFIATVTEGLSLYTNFNRLNNLWLMNIYFLLQFYLLLFQFYKWELFSLKSIAPIAALIIISVLWTLESFQHHLTSAMNKYSLIFSGGFIVILSTVYLNRLIFEKIPVLLKDPRFIINAALLIYFTSTLLIFIFAEPQFNIPTKLFMKFWAIHEIINIFTNLIFAAGLLCIRRR